MEQIKNAVQDIALWRYGLISEFLQGASTGIALSQRLEEAENRLWNHPEQGEIQIKADTGG